VRCCGRLGATIHTIPRRTITIGPISAHFFVYLDQKYYATMLPLALFLGMLVGAITLSTVADKIGGGTRSPST
jgi:hypothetical protein